MWPQIDNEQGRTRQMFYKPVPRHLGAMIETMGFNAEEYWGFMELSRTQFQSVITAGALNEGLIIR